MKLNWFEIVVISSFAAFFLLLMYASIWEVSHIEEVGTAKLYRDGHYNSLALDASKQSYLVNEADFLCFQKACEGDEVTYLVRPSDNTSVVLWPEKITVEKMKRLYTLDRFMPFLAFALAVLILGGLALYLKIKIRKLKKA